MGILVLTRYLPRMFCMALLLAPALPAFLHTLFCTRGRRRRYGRGLCQFIWLFAPPEAAAQPAPSPSPVPTTLIVSGGAWIFSSAAWGWVFARSLTARGHCVVLVNVRQWPWVDAAAQVQDVRDALALVREACPAWGGCPAHLQLFAQSAGAHLCAQALLLEAQAQPCTLAPPAGCRGRGAGAMAAAPTAATTALPSAAPPSSPPSPRTPPPLRHLVLASGVYNVPSALAHMVQRGFPPAALCSLFPRPSAVSPIHQLGYPTSQWSPAAHPPVTLLHGAADRSVPAAQSQDYAAALAAAGVRVTLHVTPGEGHTDTVLEGPLAGQDAVTELLWQGMAGGAGAGSVAGGGAGATRALGGAGALLPRRAPVQALPPVLPLAWVRLIRWVNPF